MKRATSSLSNMDESEANRKRVDAFVEILGHPLRASGLQRKLLMTSRQISAFLRDTEKVDRKKNGKVYEFYADVDCPSRITFGKEWVEIKEVKLDGRLYKKITSSQGEEKLIPK